MIVAAPIGAVCFDRGGGIWFFLMASFLLWLVGPDIGPLIRCGVAFGAMGLWVVGRGGHYTAFGAHGSDRYLKCLSIPTWPELRELATQQRFTLIGLTQQGHHTNPSSSSIHTARPFQGPVVFICLSEKVGR